MVRNIVRANDTPSDFRSTGKVAEEEPDEYGQEDAFRKQELAYNLLGKQHYIKG